MKPFTTAAVFIFSIVSLLHLLRLLFGWKIIIDGMVVPVWLSVPGFLIAAGLAFMLRRESRK